MRDSAAPGPLTLASAPTGVPAKSQMSWGGLTPGRLGREEARSLRRRGTQKLRTRSASIVSLTSSGGVMNLAFGVSISGKTPRASAQPFQT